jgi:hypothetical protein
MSVVGLWRLAAHTLILYQRKQGWMTLLKKVLDQLSVEQVIKKPGFLVT